MTNAKILTALFFLGFVLTKCAQTKTDTGGYTPQEKNAKVISDPTNKLSGTIEELSVAYTIWGCACPQWIQTKDLEKNNSIDFHFYLEPATVKLELPDYFNPLKHCLKIKGAFYERKDYPQGTVEEEEKLPKARVFRYTEMKVVRR